MWNAGLQGWLSCWLRSLFDSNRHSFAHDFDPLINADIQSDILKWAKPFESIQKERHMISFVFCFHSQPFRSYQIPYVFFTWITSTAEHHAVLPPQPPSFDPNLHHEERRTTTNSTENEPSKVPRKCGFQMGSLQCQGAIPGGSSERAGRMVSFEGEGDAVVPTPSQDVDRAPVSPRRVSILGHFLEPEVDKDLTRKSEVDLSSEVRARSIPCSIFLFSRIFSRSSPFLKMLLASCSFGPSPCLGSA